VGKKNKGRRSVGSQEKGKLQKKGRDQFAGLLGGDFKGGGAKSGKERGPYTFGISGKGRPGGNENFQRSDL